MQFLNKKIWLEAQLGSPVISLSTEAKGGNSRIEKATLASGQAFAVKSYPPSSLDPRDRLGTEFHGLQFLQNAGISSVTEPILQDKSNLIGIYRWIYGRRPVTCDLSVIDSMIVFLKQLRTAQNIPTANAIPYASESCLSCSEIKRQLVGRYRSLAAVSDEPFLSRFLDSSVRPSLERLLEEPAPIPRSSQILSPGDFGIHNMIFDGVSIKFIDFEYFGWDDPAKLILDTILHPSSGLDLLSAERFVVKAVSLYLADDLDLKCRISKRFSYFGLRWVLILLNEFLPNRWEIRKLAGAKEWSKSKQIQLEKAIRLYDSLPTFENLCNNAVASI